MSDSGETPPRRGPRALGRRVALGIYVAGILFVAGNATWQITKQVWFPDPPAEPAPFKSCEAGLRAFYRSIEGARVAARFSDPGGDRHEDRAVARAGGPAGRRAPPGGGGAAPDRPPATCPPSAPDGPPSAGNDAMIRRDSTNERR